MPGHSAPSTPTQRLRDKVAIVTGAASGFGARIAGRFHAEGARVVLADLNLAAAQALAQRLGDDALAVQADVTQAAEVQAMVDAALARFGAVHILVNNAGTTHAPSAAVDVDEALFDRVFAVNVKSIYHGVRSTVPVFRRQGGGVVLNVGSIGGLRPRPGLVWYGASKGAVANLSRGLAAELAPLGIRVNHIAPAVGATPLLDRFVGGDHGDALDRLVATIPLGRLCAPDDVAAAAVYLASDDAAFVTGIDLCVDGGRNI
ncbi:glucose 1-dehydrogenase [Pseudorhodoferax sp.]|uniref:glucose 1-dehydrogenase n=1 Tax=Pseudorhodoferax sp. TaxID=1993553 RepID=UPI002DD620B8|nr:glucose 1-dehydrogenase [Pseudorhodoferax sp.]